MLQYVASKSGVVFASMAELVSYMKAPVSLEQLQQAPRQCVSATPTWTCGAGVTSSPVEGLCGGKTIHTCYYSSVLPFRADHA